MIDPVFVVALFVLTALVIASIIWQAGRDD